MWDRILAGSGLLLCSPFLLVMAAAIWFEDGAPVLFRQVRVGRFGKRFEVLKFRSMRRNQAGKALTAEGDRRVTRCGRVLRKYKLDELPQLWNVVRGEMSLIGPRPEVPQFVTLADPDWTAVLQVKPGITDLATLAYRNEEKILAGYADVERGYREVVLPAKLALNREYLMKRSNWSDIKLLALTIHYSFMPADFDAQQIKQAVLPAPKESGTCLAGVTLSSSPTKAMSILQKALRRAMFTSIDAVLIAVSLVIAMVIRFDFSLPLAVLPLLLQGLAIALVPKLLAIHLTGSDRGAWRHTGLPELYRLGLANTAGSIGFTAATLLIVGPSFPRSVYCIDLLICFLVTCGTRASVRMFFERQRRPLTSDNRRVLIYGAGNAGRTLLKEIRSNPALNYQVVGFLDDDTRKTGVNIMGAIVLGRGRDAARIIDRAKRKRMPIHEIVIAMPSAGGIEMHNALANCRSAGVPCKTIPGVGELLSGQVLTKQIRNVKVDDLLGRQPVHLDTGLVRSAVEGQNVMVTGGGGSIGSELCRQVASFGPGKLVIFEQSEAGLFYIHQELTRKYPRLNIVPSIGDIKEYSVVSKVIRTHKIESIFHAAAYKHVPMMEAHLLEAVKNNVLGTGNVARAAYYNQVAQFLMISSDKAVNPTNIMGLTKRVAELIVTAMPLPSEGGPTKFCSVRFGNVLGSSGSVVPMFEEQIATGGPVTVTHPEMRRFFMTVREAVQLVLQASTMGKGSEVFVLDMGEPVKIVELARNMIRLAGREPDVDIEIRFVGIRPGEKLYEEVLVDGENIMPTYHKKIRIFAGARKSASTMENWLSKVEKLIADEDEAGIVTALSHLVPEYMPSSNWAEMIQPAVPEIAAPARLRASAAGIQ